MENFSFLVAKENLPFAVALTVMLFISLIEFLTTIMGMGLSHILDNILHFHPETFDISHDIHHDISHDTDAHDFVPVFTKFLGWIRYGHIPLLIVFITFLMFFSIIGFVEQLIASRISDLLPSYIAIWPALFITIPLVRISSLLLGKFLIKDETTSVSLNTFIGKKAIITIGIACKDKPAEAKLVDEFKQTHYVMVEPIDNVTFSSGTEVLIIEKKADHLFLVKQINL
jgi:hypothetical protein